MLTVEVRISWRVQDLMSMEHLARPQCLCLLLFSGVWEYLLRANLPIVAQMVCLLLRFHLQYHCCFCLYSQPRSWVWVEQGPMEAFQNLGLVVPPLLEVHLRSLMICQLAVLICRL